LARGISVAEVGDQYETWERAAILDASLFSANCRLLFSYLEICAVHAR
jgi:hypothetical protein